MSDSLQESGTRSNGRIHPVLQGFNGYFRVIGTISAYHADGEIFSDDLRPPIPSPGGRSNQCRDSDCSERGLGIFLLSGKNFEKTKNGKYELRSHRR
jgi:hypothetical protein